MRHSLMGEHIPAHDITDGIDVRDICLHISVHDDPLRSHLQSYVPEVHCIQVRPAANGHKNLVRSHGSRLVFQVIPDLQSVGHASHTLHRSLGDNADTLT